MSNGDGAERHRLTAQSDGDHRPAWSPDGTRVAFDRESWSDEAVFGIIVVDVRSGADVRLTSGGGAFASWTADGRSVVFAAEGEIRRVPSEGGAQSVLQRGELPAASPVGETVAFVRGRALWTMALERTGARRLAALAPKSDPREPPRWSRDGRRLAIADAAGILVVDAGGRHSRHVGRAGASLATWSPDGGRLAFAAPVGPFTCSTSNMSLASGLELFVVSATGGEARRLTHDLASIDGIAWR